MELKSGSRWRSTVCDGEVVVVRTAAGDIDLRCGGLPMLAFDAGADGGRVPPAADRRTGAVLGKRYTDREGAVEVLCTKVATGTLTIGDEVLDVKAPKPLPASD